MGIIPVTDDNSLLETSLPSPRYLLATIAAAGVALAGCSTPPNGLPETSAAAAGAVKIVTSTNVWAAVATAVGGDLVSVSAVLDDPSADPHSFEATPATKLAMSDAAVVLVNGGGYDDWAIETVESLDAPPTVINAVQVSGLDAATAAPAQPVEESETTESPEEEAGHEGHNHGEFNEHVFYDLDSVIRVADALAAQLGVVSPDNATAFTGNAAKFTAKLDTLKEAAADIGSQHPDTDVISTEPVVGYLLEDMGIHDITPEAFSAAVETDAEVSVKDLADTKDLITSRQAALLFNNIQTSGTVTDDLVATAESAGIAVIGVTETLPEGTSDYAGWIEGTINAVSGDLSK